jgi:twitching motility protein PilT
MIDVFPDEQQTQIRTQLSNILEVVIAQRLIPLDHGGRRAVAEILIVNPAIKNLIREKKSHQVDNVIRTSSDIGMVSLERALVNLVREGVIGIKTAQEYAVYPEEVSRLLKS